MASHSRSDLSRRTAIESMLNVVETVRVRLRTRVERTGLTLEELAVLRALSIGSEVDWDCVAERSGLDTDALSIAVEALIARQSIAWVRHGHPETVAIAISCAGVAELVRADRALQLDPRDEKPSRLTGDPAPRAATDVDR